jgi:hypothetical protein
MRPFHFSASLLLLILSILFFLYPSRLAIALPPANQSPQHAISLVAENQCIDLFTGLIPHKKPLQPPRGLTPNNSALQLGATDDVSLLKVISPNSPIKPADIHIREFPGVRILSFQNHQVTRLKIDPNIHDTINNLINELIQSSQKITLEDANDIKFFIKKSDNASNELILFDSPPQLTSIAYDAIQLSSFGTSQISVSINQLGDAIHVLVSKGGVENFYKVSKSNIQTFWQRILEILLYPFLRNNPTRAIEVINSNPTRFGKLLNIQSGGVDAILIQYRGDVPINFNRVFPNKRIFLKGNDSIDEVKVNIENVTHKSITIRESEVISGIPKSEAEYRLLSDQLGQNEWQEWRRISEKFNNVVPSTGGTRGGTIIESIQKSLAEKRSVVIVGHSDGEKIYFVENGKRYEFGLKEITDIKEQIKRNRPNIVLLNCRTGKNTRNLFTKENSEEGISIAQALLDSGAESVIAPVGDIDAEVSINFMQKFFEYGRMDDINTALRKSLNEVNEGMVHERELILDHRVERWITAGGGKNG